MYSLNMPVSTLRTKMREEFERHRYVNTLPVVDTLLFKSHAEFQVRERLQTSLLGGGNAVEGTSSGSKGYLHWTTF